MRLLFNNSQKLKNIKIVQEAKREGWEALIPFVFALRIVIMYFLDLPVVFILYSHFQIDLQVIFILWKKNY